MAARHLTETLGLAYAADYLRIGMANGMSSRSTAVLLEHAWMNQHGFVWVAAAEEVDDDSEIPAIMKRWFEHARFRVGHLPNTMTVWRGGVCDRSYPPSKLAGGFSWSLHRGAAADFAVFNPLL